MNDTRGERERTPEPPDEQDGGHDDARRAPGEVLKEALSPVREHEGVWFPKVQLKLAPARRSA